MHSDKQDTLALKLKTVTRQRMIKERDVYKLRNKERTLNEELLVISSEVEFFTDQLQSLKDQLAQTRQQISMIDICTASEKCKLEKHSEELRRHREGFQLIFNKDREIIQLKNKELKEKEAEEEEILKKKQRQIADINEQQAMEVAAIEDECEFIEKECAVLKKRNNAIMLKLRRKLLETENNRRELMKQNVNSVQASQDQQ